MSWSLAAGEGYMGVENVNIDWLIELQKNWTWDDFHCILILIYFNCLIGINDTSKSKTKGAHAHLTTVEKSIDY